MPQSKTFHDHVADVAPVLPARSTPPGTRVDTAHPRADEMPVATPAPAPVAARPAIDVLQQVQSQAAQLATHLQRQQASIDHRESELNARNAAIENQVRGARLWLSERHSDLSQRQADLDRREKELAQREAELVLNARQVRKPLTGERAPATDQGELDARRVELDRRQSELDALAARLSEQVALAAKSQDVEHMLRDLETRREHLDRAEKLLTSEHTEIELARKRLGEDRSLFAEQSRADRARLAEDERAAMAEVDKCRRELARQADELANRQSVIERMRAELARQREEALEIRLATEELWSRLCGTMAPAALTQSLAQIRLQLAEEFRLARADLAQQKTEIQELSVRVAEQHERLARERGDIQSWTTARHKELEKQAGLLVAGQQKLDNERAELTAKSLEWQNERFRLQQEIRRLTRQVGRPTATSA